MEKAQNLDSQRTQGNSNTRRHRHVWSRSGVLSPLDLVQYIALGPDLRSWLLPAFKLLTGTTLDNIISLKDGGFAKLWVAVFAAAMLWTAMIAFVLLRVDERCKSVPGCQTLGEVSEIFAPLISNLCFLPIVSILLDVFVCTEGVGFSESSVSYTNSYLHKDCYLHCWKGSHVLLVIGSSISLAIFIPASTILRPLWQELETALNIKTAPGFLVFKSAVQTIIIVLNKTITNRIAHCCLFTAVMASFTVFSVKAQTFNYRRVAFCHKLALFAVLWSSVLRLLQIVISSSNDIVFLVFACTGWALLALFGAIYQWLKIPSYLFRKRGVQTEFLFKFAFQKATPTLLSQLAGTLQQAGNRCSVMTTPGKYEIGGDGNRELDVEF